MSIVHRYMHVSSTGYVFPAQTYQFSLLEEPNKFMERAYMKKKTITHIQTHTRTICGQSSILWLNLLKDEYIFMHVYVTICTDIETLYIFIYFGDVEWTFNSYIVWFIEIYRYGHALQA